MEIHGSRHTCIHLLWLPPTRECPTTHGKEREAKYSEAWKRSTENKMNAYLVSLLCTGKWKTLNGAGNSRWHFLLVSIPFSFFPRHFLIFPWDFQDLSALLSTCSELDCYEPTASHARNSGMEFHRTHFPALVIIRSAVMRAYFSMSFCLCAL